MNPSEFLVQCTVLLESDQTTEVLQLLKDEENKVEFQFCFLSSRLFYFLNFSPFLIKEIVFVVFR